VSQTIILVADHNPVRMRERVKRVRDSVGDGPSIISLPSLDHVLRFVQHTVREFGQRRPSFVFYLEADMPPVSLSFHGLTMTDISSEKLIHLLQCQSDSMVGRSAVFLPSADPASGLPLRWIDPEETDAPPKSGTHSLRPRASLREASAS
jgi:hypothetical protein